MLNKVLVALSVLLVLAGCQQNKSFVQSKSINPNAIEEVNVLLNYLYSIKGKKILSGQHCYTRNLSSFTDSVIAITGKKHVVWGSDFIVTDYRLTMIQEAIQKHKEGFVITLMYHQSAPIINIPKGVVPRRYKMSEQEWTDLITTGTDIHENWLKDIDEVAAGLKILQDYSIPVLWRPYHEMNGAWFWWGDKKGKDGYEMLWKMMYYRFTNYHKLNNLIWVWNANAPRDKENDEAYAYELYYPGNKYVDVLATDIYNNDYQQSHHDELLTLGQGKLIAIGECGKLPSPQMLDSMNQFVWFMEWANWLWKVNEREKVQQLYNSNRIITLDEHKNIFNN